MFEVINVKSNNLGTFIKIYMCYWLINICKQNLYLNVNPTKK